jgi:hypothetical protein
MQMLEKQHQAASGLFNKPFPDPSKSPVSVDNSFISENTSQDGLPISESEDD